MGHDHPIGWRPKEIAAFFNSIFKGGIPLAKITNIEKQATSLVYKYKSTTDLSEATFYYSNDTSSINANRAWKSMPANINQDSIWNPYPKEGFKLGFLYIKDQNNLTVSSELLVN